MNANRYDLLFIALSCGVIGLWFFVIFLAANYVVRLP